MSGFHSPPPFLHPLSSPRRAASPSMSPAARRARTAGSSEESHLRDLSPNTTLRAFTERPVPFDTSRDEFKIFACIDSLTAAERDLGVRVAKAAQRLKSWCREIEQWGWSGSFEQPSEQYRESRRKSLERRVREHVKDADAVETIPPLEYWGSMLSVEVEAHEARLDEIGEDLLSLDIEELKEHVLERYGTDRSRPSSSGHGSLRRNYTPLDDFSFLITQTLLSALPEHYKVRESLQTWTARVSVLREAPRFLGDLQTARKAMQLGWTAIDPPTDFSDDAFDKWKVAVDTISSVLRGKVRNLGQRLDHMLDTLEGHEDCLPDDWIDVFEGVDADYGRWAHESRTRIIDFDVRRKGDQSVQQAGSEDSSGKLDVHSSGCGPTELKQAPTDSPSPAAASPPNAAHQIIPAGKQITPAIPSNASISSKTELASEHMLDFDPVDHTTQDATQNMASTEDGDSLVIATGSTQSSTAMRTALLPTLNLQTDYQHTTLIPQVITPPTIPEDDESVFDEGNTVVHNQFDESEFDEGDTVVHHRFEDYVFDEGNNVAHSESEESVFDEGDTVVHNQFEESMFDEGDTVAHDEFEAAGKTTPSVSDHVQVRHLPETQLKSRAAIPMAEKIETIRVDRPQTPPRSRGNSTDSISSALSYPSSPVSAMEDSPSVRINASRQTKAPRPELNATMGKRRPLKIGKSTPAESAPWPPSQFSQQLSPNSAEELERKISDILTTIPAHIRLTSGPGADAHEVKSTRRVSRKGSKGYLRPTRSMNGLKSPELTLSPARNDSDSTHILSGRRSSAALRADNDIKLYHLTQPGKEQPVKLFIRRVGENGERVMVRVGGGWADLGEYLRQYAEHHGRRTASEGKFEILGLEVKGPDSPRPESAMSKRTVGSPTTTPKKGLGLGVAKDDPPPPMPTLFGTPLGATADSPSAPSTTSSRQSWQGNEVGLAGPKSRKLDLSNEKMEWIEGMMKQARTVSSTTANATQPTHRERAYSRPDSQNGGRKPEFGDLGKVGGTKRLFFKGGQMMEH